MAKRPRHTPEQVIGELREAEVKPARGAAIARACKELAIAEGTYRRWRREYGGMKLDRARRLKDPEEEDARPERLLADAEPGVAILKEAASGEYRARRSGARSSSTSAGCSAPTASRGAGPARSWAGPAPHGGARPPCPMTSPGWWSG